jgi:hypothetical protein
MEQHPEMITVKTDPPAQSILLILLFIMTGLLPAWI